jgi:hypothetical protein
VKPMKQLNARPNEIYQMHAASTCALPSRLLFLPASGSANECFAYFVCRRSVMLLLAP